MKFGGKNVSKQPSDLTLLICKNKQNSSEELRIHSNCCEASNMFLTKPMFIRSLVLLLK